MVALLLVLAPVSASACDLSCWLHQAHSDCHLAQSGSESGSQNQGSAMSMPPGMDMGPGAGAGAGTRMHPGSRNSESQMTPRELVNGTPDHFMSRMELVTDGVEHAAERNPRTNATPAPSPASSPVPSNDLLDCIHGLCSQVSALASPPSAGGFQPGSPHSISIDISVLINRSTGPLTGLRASAIGTAPPKILAADRLLTPLRI
jgi:hypothetical protein